jgi:hypothetical protein
MKIPAALISDNQEFTVPQMAKMDTNRNCKCLKLLLTKLQSVMECCLWVTAAEIITSIYTVQCQQATQCTRKWGVTIHNGGGGSIQSNKFQLDIYNKTSPESKSSILPLCQKFPVSILCFFLDVAPCIWYRYQYLEEYPVSIFRVTKTHSIISQKIFTAMGMSNLRFSMLYKK